MKSKNIKLTGNMLPKKATHPGALIKDEINFRVMKQKQLALELDLATNVLSELIKGKRNITPAIAIKLEKALGIDAIYWMRLQVRYDILTLKLNHHEQIGKARISAARKKSISKGISAQL